MPSFCSVVGCSKRAERDAVRFFWIPAAFKDRGDYLNALSNERRNRWIRSLKRGDLTETFLKNGRICSKHFISEAPAQLEDKDNPDWVPMKNLGYITAEPKTQQAAKRHARSMERSSKKGKQLKEETHNAGPSTQVNVVVQEDEEVVIQEEISATRIHGESVSCAIQTDLTMENLSSIFKDQEFCNNEIIHLKRNLQKLGLRSEHFEGADEKTHYFTGMINYAMFNLIFLSMLPYISSKKALSPFQQVLLTLMKLRLNLPFKYLAYRFGVSRTTASETFLGTLHIMFTRLKRYVYWPSRDQLQKNVPSCFQEAFGNCVTVIIDCFEVFTETPSKVINASQCWSNYKHHETVKFLIGITPQGTISYISEAWGGKTSDKHLTENCDFFYLILPGDVILADRGFLVEDSVKMLGAELKIPAFTKGCMLLCKEDSAPCLKDDCMCKFTYDFSHEESLFVNEKLLDTRSGDLPLKSTIENKLQLPFIYEEELPFLDAQLLDNNFQNLPLNNTKEFLNAEIFTDLKNNNFLNVDSRKLNSGKDNLGQGVDEGEFIYDEASLFLTARELVLQHCNQNQPLPFTECYHKSLLQNCQKIGEGIYGEVFLYKNEAREPTVIKVIPIEGHQMVNGQLQQSFQDVLTEINIAKKLSNLHYNRTNHTSGFIKVLKMQCVQGKYPEELLDLWELYDETRGSQNDSPEIFKDDQLYVVLETGYGGTDLEAFIFDDAVQAYSVFVQVAWTLAVAEAELKFEHRDLHWGNILVSRVPKEKIIKCKLNNIEIEIKSYGVETSIIDFNMSRVECGGTVIFSDIGQDLSYFNATGDYQFEIYKLMQQKNGNEWRHFEPYTNILWLSYVLDKAISSLRYQKEGKKHKEYMSKIKELNLDILGYDSTKDFAVNYLLENYI